MKVPFVDLGADYASQKPEIDAAMARVAASGRYILGPEVKAFECEFAQYCGAEYAVGVDSGSSALALALRLYVAQPEHDEVIVPAMTFVATANAVIAAGGKLVLADIDPKTHTLDPESCRAAITENTVAIVPVHLHGLVADMDALMKLAGEDSGSLHDVAIVEDACQAHGARHGNCYVGAIGDCGCFSFYPTKNLGGMGDGGMVVTDDKGAAETLRSLRDYGRAPRGWHAHIGGNHRLDELQAAILRVKLPKLKDWNARRRRLAGAYNERLHDAPGVAVPLATPAGRRVYHVYSILHPDRYRLRAWLQTRGIETVIHYERAIHQQPCHHNEHKWPDGMFPVAEQVAAQTLSLPLFPSMTEDQVDYVCECVRSFR